MKAACFLALGCLGASAQASFDLMLVLQTLERPNGNTATVITRWDPMNGIYLGDFGAGQVTGSSITLDPWQSGQVLNVYGNSQGIFVRRLDYSTGQVVGTSSIGVISSSITSSQMVSSTDILLAGVFSGVGDARVYSTAGALVRNYTMPAGTLEAMDALRAPDGTTYILSRQAGTVSGNRFTLTSYSAGSSAIAATETILDNANRLLNDLVLSGTMLLMGGERWGMQHSTTVSGTSLGSPIGPWTGLGTGLFDSEGWANGHGDTIYSMGYEEEFESMYLGTISGGGSISSYQHFAGAQYGDPRSIAVVLAPEPGTLLALGAGLGLILRRRRR